MNPGSLRESRNYGLDLVRCIAVALVWVTHSIRELFHISVPYFWYVSLGGVELFFSLSGFLIGRILLNVFLNDEFKSVDILSFWVRRWFRILPLYFILYFVYLLMYNLIIHPVRFNISYLFFLHNIWNAPIFFGESWSLSIEEWFYLCVPLLIFGCYALLNSIPKAQRAKIAYLSAAFGLIVGMIIFRQISGWKSIVNEAVMYRMDAIAYGLLAAYFSSRFSSTTKKTSVIRIVAGLFIWLVAVLIRLDSNVPLIIKTIYYPLCGTGTALFIFGMYFYSFSKRFSFITFISIRSYSIYLVHLSGILIPLAIVTAHLDKTVIFLIWLISFPAILIVSNITYRFIELPFLKFRNSFSNAKPLSTLPPSRLR